MPPSMPKRQDLTESNVRLSHLINPMRTDKELVVHGANGYLIAQFLDYNSNKRTDQWGGSVENRCRFGLEVLKVLVEVFGPDVSVKLSPCGGYNDVGMPLQDTLDTFSYFITEAEKLNLSYFTLVRYAEAFDVVFDGKHRSTKFDVLEAFRPYIKKAKLFLNAGVTPEEGSALVETDKVDAVVIGFNYVTHPDVAQRVLHNIPLNNIPDIKHVQTKGDTTFSTGYTDYPIAVY